MLLCGLVSIKVNVIKTSHNDIIELSGKRFSKMKFNGSKCRFIYMGGGNNNKIQNRLDVWAPVRFSLHKNKQWSEALQLLAKYSRAVLSIRNIMQATDVI